MQREMVVTGCKQAAYGLGEIELARPAGSSGDPTGASIGHRLFDSIVPQQFRWMFSTIAGLRHPLGFAARGAMDAFKDCWRATESGFTDDRDGVPLPVIQRLPGRGSPVAEARRVMHARWEAEGPSSGILRRCSSLGGIG